MSALNPGPTSGPTNCRIDPPVGDGVAVPLVQNRQRRSVPAPSSRRQVEDLDRSTPEEITVETPPRCQNPATLVNQGTFADSVLQRVDRPHTTGVEKQRNSPAATSEKSPSVDREAWLKLHAAELIRRLQTWANGLDAREASLNAACARQDLRERQFRLKQAEFQAEMDDTQLAVDEMRRQIAAQSRRLAFQSLK